MTQDQALNPSMPADTTYQQDLVTAGQRRVNLVWEFTQASVAIIITLSTVFCSIKKLTSPELTNAFFLIIGFYFSRTNHAAIGGVGFKRASEYVGR